MPSQSNLLRIDPEKTVQSIAEAIRQLVLHALKRRGAVVAVSGGIDSSVCAALCVRALGPDRVFLLALPERTSSPDSLALAEELARSLGTSLTVEPIGDVLHAAGCYERQRQAVAAVFPHIDERWKFKVVLPSIVQSDRLPVPRVVVRKPDGSTETQRLPADSYLGLVAATNFKQRTRTTFSYYHADRLNYAVCGTPNRLEYDQGFFVKGGDGLADFKPIAHLYKSQVFAVAEAIGIPEAIRQRTPTTDTYSLPQTQEEFYFSLPYEKMDLCLFGYTEKMAAAVIAAEAGLSDEVVERVYRDIESKRRATLALHLPALKVRGVEPIDGTVKCAASQEY